MVFRCEQSHQSWVSKEFFAPGLNFLEHADVAKLLEVHRSRLPLREPCFHHVGDTAVGLDKDQLNQFAAVEDGYRLSHMVGG